MRQNSFCRAKSPMEVVTASFGVATATLGSTETPENLVRAADWALYEAKRQGRNRVVRGPTLDGDRRLYKGRRIETAGR